MTRQDSYHYKAMTRLESVCRFFAAFIVSMFVLSLIVRVAGWV